MADETQDGRDWSRTKLDTADGVTLIGKSFELHGGIVDISHSGVFVAIKGELPPKGSPVRVEFAAFDRAVSVVGVVIRHGSQEEPHGIALRLHGVRLEDRMSLDTLLERARKQVDE